MARLLALAALFGAFFVFPTQSTSAAPGHPGKMARVTVILRGQAVAQDPHFRVRDRWTRWHVRLDPTLPAAQWYSQQLQAYQSREISFLRTQGITLTPSYTFHALLNGFEAELPASQVAKLRDQSNVLAVVPQQRPVLFDENSNVLANVPAGWSSIPGGGAAAGKGIMIANIDTGIDITNPCFSDKNMPAPPFSRRGQLQFTNNKVIVARAFGPDPSYQYSAQDVSGHGTFTASIEACDYNTTTALGTSYSGVAPAAWLMSYNVFPQLRQQDLSGPGYDPILPALEAAEQDGADVINMSLGLPVQTVGRMDPDQIMVQNAVKAGIPVSVSAGNAGPMSLSVSSPANAPGAIAVGASTNSKGIYSSVEVTGPSAVPDGLAHIKASQGSLSLTKTVGPLPLQYIGMARKPGDEYNTSNANDMAGVNLTGKIALIERGEATFEAKLKNAAAAGASGAIIFDDLSEAGQFIADVGTATLPMLFIDKADGQALLAWLQQHPDATVTLDPTKSILPETPNILSDFSSRGGVDYAIKPDLVGPGEDIYGATQSEFPPNPPTISGDLYDKSGWTSGSGTSFSAPHVTGAVALLLQKFSHLTPGMIATHGGWVKSMLMDTASPAITLNPDGTGTPSVLAQGAGLLDVGSALSSTAFLAPASLSFGSINAGYGPAQRNLSIALEDAGNGAGTWRVAVKQQSSVAGVTVTPPASVTLPANGTVSAQVQVSVTGGAGTGDVTGNIVFTNGSQTLHAPYDVHVVNHAVKQGSVLLVDDTTSLFQTEPPNPPVQHRNVTGYFEKALSALGRSYTYWDEASYGAPLATDMQRASAVIYFTGSNLNAVSPQNTNPETSQSPLSGTDETEIDAYLRAGGRVFITGVGAAFADPYFAIGDLGANQINASIYDTTKNDPDGLGGISPPRPSIYAGHGHGAFSRVGPFYGLKPIDISTHKVSPKGDGAGDSVSVNNQTLGSVVGVSSLQAVQGNNVPGQTSYGQWALSVPNKFGQYDVGITDSQEPTFKHPKVAYHGRSVLFSFGLEGINDNTGYATRAQVLQRVFQWLSDHPSATVMTHKALPGHHITLYAKVHTGSGAKPAVFQWQIDGKTLGATSGPTQYTFPHAGKYRVRVLATDSIGHSVLSTWATVTVK